ncbi:glycine cleavage system H protein (lipoate-binding) [Levilactobacillus enshiensis]|uniref:glycine cleavage system H protein (lipoate-binding) n=1 Tax=Levilactobacillus enshiensis TaxID=2590213 RepID=UPI00117ABA87|nr:glycine cleavage system H protein (lipoate-binding) [Levilactobacillus enshiensis]
MIDRIEASADALWLTPNAEGVVRIGFADDGRELVGPVTKITWQKTSGQVRLGTPLVIVHGEKEEITLRSPFAGRIAAVNTDLVAHPERLNNRNDDLDWMVDLVDD